MKQQSIFKDQKKVRRIVLNALAERCECAPPEFSELVRSLLAKRKRFMQLASGRSTPAYVFDREALQASIRSFTDAFALHVPKLRTYYAVKINSHPLVLSEIAKAGLGFDVSSPYEFSLVRKYHKAPILYTGPGKTEEDFERAIQEAGRLTVNIDSFGELKRLGAVAKRMHREVHAGVRVFGNQHGNWSKFGIPLKDLRRFFRSAQKHSYVHLDGIQFHKSWNPDGRFYDAMFLELARHLRVSFTQAERRALRFIDFGGGFRPYRAEGCYPWATSCGELYNLAGPGRAKDDFFARYYMVDALPIEGYAAAIGDAIERHLSPLVDVEYLTEPGRAIAHTCMHVLLKVIDRKSPDRVIVDGGMNMVGWDKFDYEYFPVLNMSRPSGRTERAVQVFGPHCMTRDVWGHYVYGALPREGDLLVVPNQGALTWAWAQTFIREIPPVLELPEAYSIRKK